MRDPTEVQQQAKALGDPTRHRIFRHIAETTEPVTVSELTDLVGLNHNAVRQHLAVLRDSGLVIESVEKRVRPGRPRLLYKLSPEAAGSWDTQGPYEFLAELLTGALATGSTPREAGREAGRRQGAGLVQGTDGLEAIEDDLARRGFRPSRVNRGSKVDFILERCPFENAAAAHPQTVCQLHLGLAEGFVEEVGGLEVERLVAKNPHRAGCRLAVRRSPRDKGS